MLAFFVYISLMTIWYVYILYSSTINKYYIGFTSNLEQRLIQHNSKHKGFTSAAKDWEILYSEEYNEEQTARAREKQIKKWKSRQKIVELINSAP